MRIEKWRGHEIRFIQHNGSWWAYLNDIIRAFDIYVRTIDIDSNLIDEIEVNGNYEKIIDELAIYDIIQRSETVPAIQFQRWSSTVMQRLRKNAGLQGYEICRMLDKDIQDNIDHILDTIFYDEETGKLMRSVTVAGGDVEIKPFFE